MKMKYTEQAVETLDDAGSVIANKNIEIEQLRQRVAGYKLAINVLQEQCRDYQEQAEIDAELIKSDGKEIHFLIENLAVSQQRVAKLESLIDLDVFSLLRRRVAELEKERDQLLEVKAAENASWNAGFNVQADQIATLTAERDTLKQQRDVFLAALVDIQQVACSGSPELGIASDALASVKERE